VCFKVKGLLYFDIIQDKKAKVDPDDMQEAVADKRMILSVRNRAGSSGPDKEVL
jgi:hypothetical protein